jgi:hypothetical protein
MRSRGILSYTVIDEPGEVRVFALVLTLAQCGNLNSENFRWCFGGQFAAAGRDAANKASCYQLWRNALESVLSTKLPVSKPEIAPRADAIAANRPSPIRSVFSSPVRIAWIPMLWPAC